MLFQAACSEPATVNLTVFATELTVYASDEPNAETVGKLAYGDTVIAAEKDANMIPSSSTDHRIRIKTDLLDGYVLAAYLIPLTAPELTNSGFSSLTSRLQAIDQPETMDETDLQTISQAFSGGVTLHELHFKMPDGGYFAEERLSVAGLSVFQGALLARAIVAADGVTSHHLSITPEVETDEDGKQFVYDDSDWQIFIVKQTDTGISILLPERAD